MRRAEEKPMKKGHFFDLDMLDVGSCVFKDQENFFTEDEMIVAYSLRAFLSSPIQISAILDNVSDFELALYCNEEIIAINQDTSFEAPNLVLSKSEGDSMLHVYERLLEDGRYAYAFFNLGETEEEAHTHFSVAGAARDLWAKEDLGMLSDLLLTLPKHTVRIIKSESKAETVETL